MGSMKKQLKNSIYRLRRAGALLMGVILLFTCVVIPMQAVIAEEEKFPAIHLLEWNTDAGLTHTVEVITGRTYTFTCLFRAKKATPGVRLTGTAAGDVWLIVNDTTAAGVKYNVVTGELRYTFKAQGTELTMGVYANSLSGGQFEAYFAKPNLYESDGEGNQYGDQFFDCDPDFDTSWEKWFYGGNYRNIVEVDKSVFEKNDFPTGLASLSVGYELSPEFDYRVLYYDITVPYEVTSLDIDYTLMDGVKFRRINGNKNFKDGETNEVTIIVQGKKPGGAKENVRYIIRVFRQAEAAAQLTKLDIGYDLTPAFSPDVFEYSAKIPNEADSVNVEWEGTANTHLVSITGNTDIPVGKPTAIVVTVANVSEHETAYTVNVIRAGKDGDSSELKKILADAAKKVTPSEVDLADDFRKKLEEAADNKISVVILDFCKLNAISEVKDNFGTIIPGTKGYISALVNITDGSIVAEDKLYIELKPDTVEYTFTEDEVSKDKDFVLEENGTYLVEYTGDAKKVVIPETVTEIGFNWYQPEDKTACEVLVIPDNVQYLPENLCYGMYHLETVYMGDGISTLPPYSFNHCYFLQNVRLSENLTKIQSNAFGGCCSLYNIRLPESLKEIGNSAFTFTLLRDLTIPKGVSSVKASAFSSPFNAWRQLVRGSDNEYFMFVFNSENDPDAVRLGQISDAHVDYWDYYGNRYMTYDETLLGQFMQGLIPDPWVNGYIITTPRTVTVLNKDAALDGNVGWTVNGFYSGGNTLRLPNSFNAESIGKISQTIAELNARYDKLVKGSENGWKTASPVAYKYETLNMKINEIAARGQRALDVGLFNEKTTADDVMNAVKNAVVTDDSSIAFSWKEPFSISDGILSGVIEVKNDSYSYELTLNSSSKNIVDAAEDKPDEPKNIDVTIDTSKAPLSLLNNSCAVMDWETGYITVKPYTTIKAFLNTVKLKNGYNLRFYDDEGYEIYDVFYNTAYLEENFILQVNKGLSRVNELAFRCTYPSNAEDEKDDGNTVGNNTNNKSVKRVKKVIRVPVEAESDNTWLIYVIIAAVVIVAGAGAGVFFFIKKRPKGKNS